METLRFANTHVVVKTLNIFRNVMSHLTKREATPIALELAEKILPLFNHVSQLWDFVQSAFVQNLTPKHHLSHQPCLLSRSPWAVRVCC